ncbi:fimbria/pilus outer membrane usher protein [Rosenbergiella australiborealis]|uniref:fimbria/pilus outer membrane usher protein n=1 Tax=Rosenbergiella australiborealis TaxID=1544696 RepID=UPI001F4E77C9|nr:fimbria/pilus outer membrane usher protein [Rosenbergiella australiborealis]
MKIRVSTSLLFVVFGLSAENITYAADYDTIPKPMPSAESDEHYSLWLTLDINGRNDGVVTEVKVNDQHYLVKKNVLEHDFIHTSSQSDWIDVTTLPDVTVSYDSNHQVLRFRVPNRWLPLQFFGEDQQTHNVIAHSSGFLFNYDIYSINNRQTTRYSALWLEQRYFSDSGYLTNTGVLRKNWQRNSDTTQGYLRYDTTWRYSDSDRLVSYQLGDVVSNSLSWSNSVRLGGVRISRNFSVRPDLVTYPLLNISGTAAVPGSVDLFINGYKTSNNNVNAGPWVLTDTPYINGAGEATVVTTDALGRQVETSVPFYVANQLLRPGLSDYDFSAGALRSNYGTKNADYSAGAVSSFYRYGLSDHLTVAIEGEGREGILKGGVGLDIAPWRFGTLSISSSRSYTQQSGQQLSLGYSWVSNLFNLNVSYLQRTSHYSDLSVYDTSSSLSQHAAQSTISFSPLGGAIGSIGVGYFDITAHDDTRTQLANLSWSKSIWGNSSISLSLNKTLGDSGVSGQLQLLIPLANDSSVSMTERRDNQSQSYQTLSYSRSTPTEGGLGWNVAASTTHSGYQEATLSWKNNDTLVSGGVYGSSGNHNQWLDVNGSLVWMDDEWFTSSKINDAFIVVSTDGFSDIPVSYENRYLGKTNKQGHILIPYVSAWYPAKLDIDPLGLPPNISLPTTEQRVSVREGSGALVTFAMHKTHPLLLTVVDQQGNPLAPGTTVTERSSGQTAIIGYGGQAWFDDLPIHRQLVIDLPSPATSCHHDLVASSHENNIPSATITCVIANGTKEKE